MLAVKQSKYTQDSQNILIKQKPKRNGDQRRVVLIKFCDLLQYNMGFAKHHLSVVDS